MPTGIYIYLRKSRADGDQSVQGVLARHEGILQEYAEREYGASIPEDRIFREVVSGETITDRPMMQTLLSLLETGTVSGVLVVEPQRLSRGDLSDCGRVVNAFRYTRTPVITPTRTYDLAEKYDRKFFEMELMRGNDYLEYTKEILERGRIASVKKGFYVPAAIPYGYKRVFLDPVRHRGPTLEPNPEEAPAVRLIYELFANRGLTYIGIARHMDGTEFLPRRGPHWSKLTVESMLKNPTYIGKVRYNYRKQEKVIVDGTVQKKNPIAPPDQQIMVDGLHPAIVDPALWAKAQARIGSVPRVKVDMTVRNPLSGLIYCKCGRAMCYRLDHGSERLCCVDQPHCGTRSVKLDLVLDRLCDALRREIAEFEVMSKRDDTAEREAHAASVAALRQKLSDLDRRESEQMDLLESGIYPRETYLTRHALLLRDRQTAQEALQRLLDTQPTSVDYQEKIRRYSEALAAVEGRAPQEPTNRLLKAVVSRIDYTTPKTTTPGGGRDPSDFHIQVHFIF